jgi:hypothetical protein
MNNKKIKIKKKKKKKENVGRQGVEAGSALYKDLTNLPCPKMVLMSKLLGAARSLFICQEVWHPEA